MLRARTTVSPLPCRALLPVADCFSEGTAEPAAAPLDPTRPQVVLVHGIWDTAAKFDKMSAALTTAGWQTHAISLKPNDASVPLERSAGQLRAFIDETLGPDLRFSIVAFSMGGLVARYYLQRMGGLARLTGLVTISTPHHGTWTANFDWLPGAVEMRPGQRVPRRLEQRHHAPLGGSRHLDLVAPGYRHSTPGQLAASDRNGREDPRGHAFVHAHRRSRDPGGACRAAAANRKRRDACRHIGLFRARTPGSSCRSTAERGTFPPPSRGPTSRGCAVPTRPQRRCWKKGRVPSTPSWRPSRCWRTIRHSTRGPGAS